jgi:hypothetical protein
MVMVKFLSKNSGLHIISEFTSLSFSEPHPMKDIIHAAELVIQTCAEMQENKNIKDMLNCRRISLGER